MLSLGQHSLDCQGRCTADRELGRGKPRALDNNYVVVLAFVIMDAMFRSCMKYYCQPLSTFAVLVSQCACIGGISWQMRLVRTNKIVQAA